MRELLVVVIILAILSVGCTPVGRLIAMPTPGYYPDLHVSMHTTYWLCGVGVEIDGNGNVSYEKYCAGAPSDTIKRIGKVTPQQIEELDAAIDQAHIWTMKDRYAFERICTDCAKTELSVKVNWLLSKHISSFGECSDGAAPKALCELEHEIEAVAKSAQPNSP